MGLSAVPSPNRNDSGLGAAALAEGVADFAAAIPGTVTLAAGVGVITTGADEASAGTAAAAEGDDEDFAAGVWSSDVSAGKAPRSAAR